MDRSSSPYSSPRRLAALPTTPPLPEAATAAPGELAGAGAGASAQGGDAASGAVSRGTTVVAEHDIPLAVLAKRKESSATKRQQGAIAQMTGLKAAGIKNDRIKNLWAKARQFALSPKAHEVYMKECKNHKIVPSLAGVVRRLKKREDQLDLSNMGLGAKGRPLWNTLPHLPPLNELKLRDCRLTDDCVTRIITNMENRDQERSEKVAGWGLKHLDLGHNRLRHPACASVSHFLVETQSLHTLLLGRCNLGDLLTKRLLSGIERNRTLTTIDLSRNLISTGEVVILVDGTHPTLRSLDLSWNSLQGAAASSIARSLRNSDLTDLNLAYNRFGDAGGGGSSSPAQELGTALRFNRYLLRLDLSGNGVQGPMAVVIMEGATQHNALRRINLSSNPLGFEGCHAILMHTESQARAEEARQYARFLVRQKQRQARKATAAAAAEAAAKLAEKEAEEAAKAGRNSPSRRRSSTRKTAQGTPSPRRPSAAGAAGATGATAAATASPGSPAGPTGAANQTPDQNKEESEDDGDPDNDDNRGWEGSRPSSRAGIEDPHGEEVDRPPLLSVVIDHCQYTTPGAFEVGDGSSEGGGEGAAAARIAKAAALAGAGSSAGAAGITALRAGEVPDPAATGLFSDLGPAGQFDFDLSIPGDYAQASMLLRLANRGVCDLKSVLRAGQPTVVTRKSAAEIREEERKAALTAERQARQQQRKRGGRNSAQAVAVTPESANSAVETSNSRGKKKRRVPSDENWRVRMIEAAKHREAGPGRYYAGSGPGAKLFEVPPSGELSIIASFTPTAPEPWIAATEETVRTICTMLNDSSSPSHHLSVVAAACTHLRFWPSQVEHIWTTVVMADPKTRAGCLMRLLPTLILSKSQRADPGKLVRTAAARAPTADWRSLIVTGFATRDGSVQAAKTTMVGEGHYARNDKAAEGNWGSRHGNTLLDAMAEAVQTAKQLKVSGLPGPDAHIRVTPMEHDVLCETFGPYYELQSSLPSGAYTLDLAQRSHRTVLIELMRINNAESLVLSAGAEPEDSTAAGPASATRRVATAGSGKDALDLDLGQILPYNHFRNVWYNGGELDEGLPTFFDDEFTLPAFGILEFDFFSARRPPPTSLAKAMSSEDLQGLVDQLQDPSRTIRKAKIRVPAEGLYSQQVLAAFSMDFILRMRVLRRFLGRSQDSYLSCAQLLELFYQLFDTGNRARRFCELIVTAFSRIVDLDELLETVNKIEDESVRNDVRVSLADRVGWLSVFNPLRPDGRYHTMNLTIADTHRFATIMTRLADVEPGENWDDEAYNDRGTWIPGWELPLSWLDKVPELGLLSFTYTSDPEAGCRPDWTERQVMCAKFLCGPEALVKYKKSGGAKEKEGGLR